MHISKETIMQYMGVTPEYLDGPCGKTNRQVVEFALGLIAMATGSAQTRADRAEKTLASVRALLDVHDRTRVQARPDPVLQYPKLHALENADD